MRKIKQKLVEQKIAETGLSIHAWALSHGFAPTTLNAWINGKRNIGGKNLLKLAEALRVDPEEICSVVFKVDDSDVTLIQEMDSDLIGAFHQLTRVQKERVIRMVIGLAEANRAEEELKHGQ